MNNPSDQIGSTNPRDFWDSLHLDILASNQNITHNDYKYLIESSLLFSLFSRDCHPLELNALRKILSIKEHGYVLILNLELPQSSMGEDAAEVLAIYHFLNSLFIDNHICIGPLIANRVVLLITEDSPLTIHEHREKSYSLCNDIISGIKNQFQMNVTIGIGSPHPINAIYSSFIDAFSALYYCSSESFICYQDIKHTETTSRFDYLLAEKHLIEAMRLRKSEAFDYFSLVMDQIRFYSDEARRNKILEILVLASHAMHLDSQNDFTSTNYIDITRELMEAAGDELIEIAYKHFIFMISYAKPQTNIDYSNHIVKVTQEYLEGHYSEDISLEDIAAQVNISPQYFSKLIKKNTGFNFIDWLSMLRVKKAKELLTNSDLTVKEVCFMVGYKDPNYFSRIFKKRIGITPSEYIKKQLLY